MRFLSGQPQLIRSLLIAVMVAAPLPVKAALELQLLYVEQPLPRPPVLSNILPEPTDAGLRGGELAIQDNNTTGRFLQHHYQLTPLINPDAEALIAEVLEQSSTKPLAIIANLPSDTLAKLSAALPANSLIFNAAAKDDKLRTTQCLPNVLHTIPSRAMLADALGQWLRARRLTRWLLIRGEKAEDLALTEAFKRASKRYAGKIVEEKVWNFQTDLRRTAQRELPLFTRSDEYDVVLVADESGDFGEYIPYNTWLPRPVVGTQGLTATGWHRVVEQWGAAQLQSRFEALSQRWMNEKDYAAWIAARAFAEAVTRTNSDNPAELKEYLLSERFQLAAFKGRKLSFRDWNGQLRQPIALVQPRSLVSQSPQEGFLHPINELDTLGFDKPESSCHLTRK